MNRNENRQKFSQCFFFFVRFANKQTILCCVTITVCLFFLSSFCWLYSLTKIIFRTELMCFFESIVHKSTSQHYTAELPTSSALTWECLLINLVMRAAQRLSRQMEADWKTKERRERGKKSDKLVYDPKIKSQLRPTSWMAFRLYVTKKKTKI